MTIPPLSQRFFPPRLQMAAVPTLSAFVTAFAACDHSSNGTDPSCCKWICKFPGSAIGWSAKFGVDADGKAKAGAGYRNGKELDPEDGQLGTSLRMADGSPLSSEAIPYYVLPLNPFADAADLELGDVGVLIYRDVIAGVIIGDEGPHHKIGEGSIAAHEDLHAGDPCRERDGQGRCLRIRDISIPSDVIAVFFRGSKFLVANEETARHQIRARAFGFWKAIGGFLPEGVPA